MIWLCAFLTALTLLFFLLYLRERSGRRSRRQELAYIRERICDLSHAQENGYILIPSEHPEIRELAAALNRLLDAFYQKKAGYAQSRLALAQMLSNLSHDLRTPLTVLSGYSELLKKQAAACGNEAWDCPQKGSRTAYNQTIFDDISVSAERIRQKTRELDRTIDEYFTLSRLESGDMHPVLQRTDLTALCHDVLLDYYDILEDAAFTVNPAIASAPVYADTDPEAFRRILKNLIDNAIRHGGAGNYLGLTLRRQDDAVVVEVEDHGPGISETDQEQIFSRNYTTAHKASGSGLGLTIARNLARQMHGDLSVASEPGRKTVFSLVIRKG